MLTDEEYIAKHKAFQHRIVGYEKVDHLLRTLTRLHIINYKEFKEVWHDLNRISDEAHYSWSQVREAYYDNMRSTRGYV